MQSQSEKQALKWHLQVVFLYYASYADRNNYKLLKSQNYRRFLIDSETVTDHTAFPPFDIAFRKIHTTAISHSQFQELIPNLAGTARLTKNWHTPTRRERRPLKLTSTVTWRSYIMKFFTKATLEQMS